MWEENAQYVVEVYGGFVDWDDRFYICPECGDPVYEEDYLKNELEEFLCPICEFRKGEDE